MGLGDIVPEEAKRKEYRKYLDHEKQERLEEVVDKYRARFPGGVKVDFIEVSPRMDQHHGFAYHRSESSYIRIAKDAVENWPWSYVEKIVGHEMVHIWMDQNGYEYSDGDAIFNWVCGYIGADVTGTAPGQPEYEIINQFERYG